jgi:two-component system alkaline phosphatase synthesis response regulator PhoP/two-component system response regulator VicR
VAEEHPDLIVLDVMMPGLDGFGVLRQLKKDPRTEPIPVIMLTAKDDDKSVLDGWTKGVHCYLTKPFNPMELLAFVRRILDFEAEEDEDRFPI